MIEAFDKLSSFQRDAYLKRARFLLSRSYARDLSEYELAREIYNTTKKHDDPIVDTVKGMIT